VGKQEFVYRKIKGSSLINTSGIIEQNNHINIASSERAFLDFLYLEKDFHFDNLNPLNKEIIYELLPLYQSKALTKAVKKIFKNG
jgi:hypothetical protein